MPTPQRPQNTGEFYHIRCSTVETNRDSSQHRHVGLAVGPAHGCQTLKWGWDEGNVRMVHYTVVRHNTGDRAPQTVCSACGFCGAHGDVKPCGGYCGILWSDGADLGLWPHLCPRSLTSTRQKACCL